MLLKRVLPAANSLVVFEAAARHLSFTAAARELGSTQPAVSQLMRALERELGLTLFKRVYRGVLLTAEGDALFTTVQGSLLDIEKSIENLQRHTRKPRINVATDFAFAAYWLLPRLPEFQRQYEDIEVRIVTSQRPSTLLEDDIDVSIHFASSAPAKAVSLFEECVFPVCSPALLARSGEVKSHKSLAGLPLLTLGAEAGAGWMDWPHLFRHRRSQVVPTESVLSFNNYTLLMQAAIAGQGVALGWANLVDELLDSGALVALPQFCVRTQGGYFAQHDRRRDDPLMECFIAWLQQVVSNE
ncbi:MAG: LysR substrate-binding domain-containing protein [Pseudomonadales bacterium]